MTTIDLRRRRVVAGVAASVAVAAFAPSVRGQARLLVKAGDQKGNLRALLEAADELRNLPYDIQWTEFPAAAPLAEALNAEAVDFGPIGDAPLLFAIAAGTRIKAFAASRSDAYGTAVLVRPESNFKTGADLKGKSIGTNRGSIGHFIALKALTASGLKPEDAQIRFIPPAEAKLALTSGSLDAWATWEPYTAIAETAGHARVLVNGRGLWSGLSFLAGTETALAAKRDALLDLSQRVRRAQAWSYRNVAQYSAALARIIGIAPEAARLQFERRATRWISLDEQVLADQQKSADFYLSVGLLKQRLDVRQTVLAA